MSQPELILYHGDCIEVMRRLDAESIDAVICDP
jgi:predicted methyltransferase